ncbi:MAG: hypothetical protein D6689_07205 [Deltaproteobacteria bacterium]|nr:MAG: hypothetical protein D6689_07205 [Deltaproteobacteria bacterium]
MRCGCNKWVAAAWAVAAVAVSPAVQAQKAPAVASLAEELQRIRTDVELVKQAVVQVPTLAQAVKDIDAKLAVLEQDVATLRETAGASPEVVGAIDRVAARVDALAQEVAAARAELAAVERPPIAGGGGASHHGGFSWATDDGRFALSIGGYGQIRSEVALSGGFDHVDEATLRIRRARLATKGHLGSDRLTFKLVVDAAKSPSLHDLYLDYRFAPGLALRAGQWKTQFIRQFTTSSTRLAFVERSRFVDNYRYDRDVMVALHGQALDGRLGYYASFGNGAGRAKDNDNIDFNQVVRLEYALVGALPKHEEGDWRGRDDMSLVVTGGFVHDLVALADDLAGLAVNNDVDADGEVDNVRVISATAGAALRYRGASATAEWVLRRESWGTILDHPDNAALAAALNDLGGSGDTRYYQGFYVSGTYMVVPRRVMVGARVAHSRNPLLRVGGRTVSEPPLAARLLEVDGLVQLYDDRVGGRFIGLMYSFFDYNARTGPDPAGDKQHRILVETQLQF